MIIILVLVVIYQNDFITTGFSLQRRANSSVPVKLYRCPEKDDPFQHSPARFMN
jgi:hypothetical protein